MEQPPPPPLPPRSPAEGREGSAPRQDPPLGLPPATSTPSLAPSPARAAAREAGARKRWETGADAPARARRGGGEKEPERRRHRHGPPVPGSASRACPGAELVGVPALHSGSHGLPPSRVAGWRSRRCVVSTGGRRWLRGSRKVVPSQVPRTKV